MLLPTSDQVMLEARTQDAHYNPIISDPVFDITEVVLYINKHLTIAILRQT